MRITVTLEKDIATALRREMFLSGTSLRTAVNHFLRMGLRLHGKDNRGPFVVHPKPLGLPIGCGHENVEELIEMCDGSTHK